MLCHALHIFYVNFCASGSCSVKQGWKYALCVIVGENIYKLPATKEYWKMIPKQWNKKDELLFGIMLDNVIFVVLMLALTLRGG